MRPSPGSMRPSQCQPTSPGKRQGAKIYPRYPERAAGSAGHVRGPVMGSAIPCMHHLRDASRGHRRVIPLLAVTVDVQRGTDFLDGVQQVPISLPAHATDFCTPGSTGSGRSCPSHETGNMLPRPTRQAILRSPSYPAFQTRQYSCARSSSAPPVRRSSSCCQRSHNQSGWQMRIRRTGRWKQTVSLDLWESINVQ